MSFRTFTPEELSPSQRHHYLLGSVNPRPICFASTLNAEGQPNLAPYSFFNIFSSTPPIFIFSVNSRRDGSHKDTLRNVKELPEVVINLVTYPIARQMAICGVEFDTGINEFEKGGFTPIPSQRVQPFRVKESPVQFECKVLEVRSLSDAPGAANLIMAQAVLIHMDEKIFDPHDHIDPQVLDTVGRMGNFNYSRASGKSIFAIQQPPADIVVGFDRLPLSIRHSNILTGNQLARLAGVTQLPQADASFQSLLRELIQTETIQSASEKLHRRIAEWIDAGQINNAWLLILAAEQSGVV